MKTVILVPLDPVHDNAIKLLQRKLTEAGYGAIALPPGVTAEEVIERALTEKPAAILVSRTLGYKVAETLSALVDLADAAGLRPHTRLGVGGMAVTREIGAELGFDGVFSGDLNMAAVIAFIENRPVEIGTAAVASARVKPDITAGYTYRFKDTVIEGLLDEITSQLLSWVEGKSSPGIQRAKLREAMLAEPESSVERIRQRELYIQQCDGDIQGFYRAGSLPEGVRWLDPSEVEQLPQLTAAASQPVSVRSAGERPLIFTQYGTGCPVMDAVHIKVAEAWGTDGLLHFDPSWGAQREGLLDGLLSHEHDGTILTLDNLRLIKTALAPHLLWNVRGHRGLNTPETQVLAQAAGADLLKINIPYGATGGGTDPARLAVDGVYSVKLAARYGLPFDIPGNDELSGVPPHKTFAGLLVMTMLGLKLGALPIPKPLMCYSPWMMVEGCMEDNYIDMNAAKLRVWGEIIDAPIWPGEPVGFMTHTPDRVQSAVTSAVHVALAKNLGAVAVTMASSDEAYSKGPISAQARVDTLRAAREMLRFMGSAGFSPTPAAERLQARLHEGIRQQLQIIAKRGDFVAAIYEGLLGSPEDGLHPGRTGRGTVQG